MKLEVILMSDLTNLRGPFGKLQEGAEERQLETHESFRTSTFQSFTLVREIPWKYS